MYIDITSLMFLLLLFWNYVLLFGEKKNDVPLFKPFQKYFVLLGFFVRSIF